jgi:hypothetical protein
MDKIKEDLLNFMLNGFDIYEKEAKETIEKIKNFTNALSDFIAGGSPEDLRVYKQNKDGKIVEVINNLELIRE